MSSDRNAGCGLNDKVKVFDKVRGAWVTGEVSHVFPNGDLQVVGIKSWEGAVVRCRPDEVAEPSDI